MSKFSKKLFAEQLLLKQSDDNLSVRKASKEIGISASTLSRLNNQQIIPDLETFYYCILWLGIETDYFFI